MTELVTNSVKHGELDGDQPIGVDVYLNGGTVYVEVHDDGVGFKPSSPNLDPTRASGWGLWLLDELTSRWGIDNAAGTTAWFEMPARSYQPAS